MSAPSLPVATNVVRIRAQYRQYGLKSFQFFHVLTGGAVTPDTLYHLCNVYIDFEFLTGGSRLVAWSFFRNESSVLERVRATSLDAATLGEYLEVVPGGDGSGLLTMASLPEGLAPICHWLTLPASQRSFGRTYLTGMDSSVLNETDHGRLDPFSAGQMADCLSTLPQLYLSDGRGVLVLLSYQHGGVRFPDKPVSLVGSAVVDDLRVYRRATRQSYSRINA